MDSVPSVRFSRIPALEKRVSLTTARSRQRHPGAAQITDTARRRDTYSAEQIQILEGLEPVRRRPGMYIGSTDLRRLHHLVVALVVNSIDEALAGYCDTLIVTLHADRPVAVPHCR